MDKERHSIQIIFYGGHHHDKDNHNYGTGITGNGSGTGQDDHRQQREQEPEDHRDVRPRDVDQGHRRSNGHPLQLRLQRHQQLHPSQCTGNAYGEQRTYEEATGHRPGQDRRKQHRDKQSPLHQLQLRVQDC